MKFFLVILLFITNIFSFSVYSESGQYIVYETGLVIPSGADEISFIFSGIDRFSLTLFIDQSCIKIV